MYFFCGTLVIGDVAYKILALYFPENKDFQLWQPITHMFMHGGFMHIFSICLRCTLLAQH
jgi:membrane associated rhomboid family serine protease